MKMKLLKKQTLHIESVQEINLAAGKENSISGEEIEVMETEAIIIHITIDCGENEETVEEEIFECRECNFIGKTAGGVKIHERRKHRERLTSL